MFWGVAFLICSALFLTERRSLNRVSLMSFFPSWGICACLLEGGGLVEDVALLGPSRLARLTGICGLWLWGGFCVVFSCFARRGLKRSLVVLNWSLVVCVVDGEDGGEGVVREVQFGELVGQLRRSVLSVSVVRAVWLVVVIIMSDGGFSVIEFLLMAGWEVGWELLVLSTADIVDISGGIVSVGGVFTYGTKMGVVIWSAVASAGSLVRTSRS